MPIETGTIGATPYAGFDPSAGPTYSKLLGQVEGRLPGAPPDFQSLLSQGVSSPLLQSVLRPALASLRPGQELARQTFQDEFRKAGALGSGAQGVGLSRLQQGFGLQEAGLIGQILSSMLPHITQGLQQQYSQQFQAPNLLASILGHSQPSYLQGKPVAGAPGSFSGGGGGGSFGGGGTGGYGVGGIGGNFNVSPETEGVYQNALRQLGLGGVGRGAPSDDISGIDLRGLVGGGTDYTSLYGGGANYPTMPGYTPSIGFDYGGGGGEIGSDMGLMSSLLTGDLGGGF